MRRVFTLAVLGLTALSAFGADAATAGPKRPVVVELYTSQGCSSCPPADALLGRLADRRDVLALSLPVTYWDMLGWKDTLANEENTRRQKAYAAAMGRGGIYTPQIIVDGVSDVVGSREAQVEAAIAARANDMRVVPVYLTAAPDTVRIAVGAGSERERAESTVWLFRVLTHASVHILAGENEGRNVTYRNVVRDVRPVGIWKGQALSLELPRSDLIDAPGELLAVVLQEGGYGRVVGAAVLSQSEPGSSH